MRVLVWQWGRRGAGPRFAASLAAGLGRLDGVTPLLSLATDAELLREPDPPRCDLPMDTYRTAAGLAWRLLQTPLLLRRLGRALRRLRPDVAVCALPGPLDLPMMATLHRARVPVAVIVHDAEAHPGDGYPGQFHFQRALVRRADAVVVLSAHVGERLRTQRALRPGAGLAVGAHPPFDFGAILPATPHPGPRRVLSFGRLLPYKGLDLLAEALPLLGPQPELEVRVVGQGPESDALAALRALPGVTVENRWVPEREIGTLLAWSDFLVLAYREASQSGVAAAALAAGRRVVATRVGGLAEQLGKEPLATLCAPDGPSLAAAIAATAAAPPGMPPGAAGDADGWSKLGRTILATLAAAPAVAGVRPDAA